MVKEVFLRYLLSDLVQCEQILDSKHPGCTIRQIVAGPITDTPRTVTLATSSANGQQTSRTLSEVSTDAGRFSCKWCTPPGDDDDDDPALRKNVATSAKPTPSLGEGASTVASVGAAEGAAAETTTASPRQKLEGGEGGTGGPTQEGKAAAAAAVAPGWDDGGANNSTNGSQISSQPPSTVAAVATRRQEKPVSADGERSFLEAFLNGGHSPATAAAAGFDPAASARGVPASVVAEAVAVTFVGVTVVLGPVVGRVTQGSAVVLLEAGSTAAVGCVLTDGVTGVRHRQVCVCGWNFKIAAFGFVMALSDKRGCWL